MMEVTYSIKQKKGPQWELVDVSAMAGKTLEQSFRDFSGKEIVAEFIIDEKPCYICGTPHWLGRMTAKGKAVTFEQAIELLSKRNPQLLQTIVPVLDETLQVFPGSKVELVDITNPAGMIRQQEQKELF